MKTIGTYFATSEFRRLGKYFVHILFTDLLVCTQEVLVVVTTASDRTRNKVAIFISFNMRDVKRNFAQSYTAGWSSITRYSKALIVDMPFLRRTLSLRFFWSIVVDFLTDFYSLLHIFCDGGSSICTHLRGIIVICGIFIVRALTSIEEYLVPITCFFSSLSTSFCCRCARLDHLLLEL